ncbi:MAG: Fur family transcriptional regulator [Anaerolineae bacterium]
MITDKNPEELLRSQGKRVTLQRMLLLKIIQESDGHLDADEIYRLAKKKDPRLSLSTVYRTLSLLKELDLVEELHLEEEHHHYEVVGSAEHHHLICMSCGSIIEFESPLTEQLKGEIAEENDFEISGIHIDLTGLCAQCREGG